MPENDYDKLELPSRQALIDDAYLALSVLIADTIALCQVSERRLGYEIKIEADTVEDEFIETALVRYTITLPQTGHNLEIRFDRDNTVGSGDNICSIILTDRSLYSSSLFDFVDGIDYYYARDTEWYYNVKPYVRREGIHPAYARARMEAYTLLRMSEDFIPAIHLLRELDVTKHCGRLDHAEYRM